MLFSIAIHSETEGGSAENRSDSREQSEPPVPAGDKSEFDRMAEYEWQDITTDFFDCVKGTSLKLRGMERER